MHDVQDRTGVAIALLSLEINLGFTTLLSDRGRAARMEICEWAPRISAPDASLLCYCTVYCMYCTALSYFRTRLEYSVQHVPSTMYKPSDPVCMDCTVLTVQHRTVSRNARRPRLPLPGPRRSGRFGNNISCSDVDICSTTVFCTVHAHQDTRIRNSRLNSRTDVRLSWYSTVLYSTVHSTVATLLHQQTTVHRRLGP